MSNDKANVAAELKEYDAFEGEQMNNALENGTLRNEDEADIAAGDIADERELVADGVETAEEAEEEVGENIVDDILDARADAGDDDYDNGFDSIA